MVEGREKAGLFWDVYAAGAVDVAAVNFVYHLDTTGTRL